MAEKKKGSSLGKFLGSLVMAVPAILNGITSITRVIEYDARLAARSLFALLVLSFVCLSLILTSWLCLLCMLYFYLVDVHISNIMSLAIILVLNLLLLVIVGLLIVNAKNKLAFPHVRQLLSGRNE